MTVPGAHRPLPADPMASAAACGSVAAHPLAAGERWYVAMTLPHKERYAGANLAHQGIRHFLPLQLVTTRHARKFHTSLAPVFPRYLFVVLAIERQRWRGINGTLGVQRLVGDAKAPWPVPPGIVETLLLSSDSSGRLLGEAQSLRPGDKVRLLRGPFASRIGVLLQLSSSDRVQILLDIVGAPFRVNAPRDAIAAL
jgi:transcription antitermination factor NusG